MRLTRWYRDGDPIVFRDHVKPAFVTLSHHAGVPAQTCVGQYTRAVSDPALDRQRARRAAKRRAGHDRLIEPFRAEAAVALDARLEGRAYPDTDVLVRVALYDYRARTDSPRTIDAAVRYVARKNHSGGRSNYGDLYCTFCGVLLVSHVPGRRFGMGPWTHPHAVTCALMHLSYRLQPAASDVRRLPDECVWIELVGTSEPGVIHPHDRIVPHEARVTL
ncbi:MAG: hypothetical protein H0U52_16225 [Chloroflexi bacterium]|nr:hypothetical protein [Chloroflexota bacterium]